MAEDHLIDANNWVDLREGASGTIVAKLESVGYGAPGSLVLQFADWEQLIVECDRPRDTKPIELGTIVRCRVIRTEDGLRATMIRRADGSGVPIPLIAATP